MISEGVRDSRRIFDDMKVVPQTMVVPRAKR
jgi:hypothetical protein